MRKTILTTLITIPFLLGTTAMAQEEKRQLDAHEHGSGTFNIAIEGNKVEIEIEVPGMDIVGFEHEASTDEQKTAIEKAGKLLLDGFSIFTLPAGAGCKITTRKVGVPGHEENNEHKKEEGETHSEFHAKFGLECAAIEQLNTIAFPYFGNFSRAKELDVSVITEKAQASFEVTGTSPEIDLGKVIK